MLYLFRHFVASDRRRFVVLELDRAEYEGACSRVAPGYFAGVRESDSDPVTLALDLVRLTVAVPAAVKLVDALAISGAPNTARQLSESLDVMAGEVSRSRGFQAPVSGEPRAALLRAVGF